MRTLGKGLARSISGSINVGVSRIGGIAMSSLGTGLGIGAAFLGIQSMSSIFDKLLAVSPELNAAFTRLKVAIGDALVPVAFKFAEVINQHMPQIESALADFGLALMDAVPHIASFVSDFGTMVSDAIQFWTEDALDPNVWKDIGLAIVEGIQQTMSDASAAARELITGGITSVTGSSTAGTVAGAVWDFSPINQHLQIWTFLLENVFGVKQEGASSL